MQQTTIQKLKQEKSTQVLLVRDFCKLHQLCRKQEAKLHQLFGPFATASELRYNVERRYRSR